VKKLHGKRPKGKPRYIWKDIIKIDLNRMERCGLDSSGSTHGPVVGNCEYGNKPSGSIKCWECLL
jgi:hypothetical protein